MIIISFDELIKNKMAKYNIDYKDALKDVLRSAVKTRKSVDEFFKVE